MKNGMRGRRATAGFAVFLVVLLVLSPVLGSVRAEASYLPGPSITPGSVMPGNYFNIDIGGFLSHVYDVGLSSTHRALGRLWNWVIDEDLCPNNLPAEGGNGLHSFVYGLTQRDGVAGYYTYCEHCGQFSGDLINTEQRRRGFGSVKDGHKIIYPVFVCWNNWTNADGSKASGYVYQVAKLPYVYDFPSSFNITQDYINAQGSLENSLFGFVMNSQNSNSFIQRQTSYGNTWGTCYIGFFFPGVTSTYTYHGPSHVNMYTYWGTTFNLTPPALSDYTLTENQTISFSNVTLRGASGLVHVAMSRATGNAYNCYTWGFYFNGYNREDIYFQDSSGDAFTSTDSENYETTYFDLDVPVTYIDNETNNRLYGGLLSAIVDLNRNVLKLGNLGLDISPSLSFDSYEYDYSDNSMSFDLSNSDDSVKIYYGDETTDIEYYDSNNQIDNSKSTTLYYSTPVTTPANDITTEDDPEVTLPPVVTDSPGDGSGGSGSGGSISADINVDVNFPVAENETQAVIVTPEDIPSGLHHLREQLALFFTEFPGMIGDFNAFLAAGFSYIPDEIITLITFGMTVSVFVGIFRFFWR